MTSGYTDDFYQQYLQGSFISAKTILGYLFEFYRPSSMVDVGCGQGAWLAAADTLGLQTLVGIDGHWVDQAKLASSKIDFVEADLNDTRAPKMRRRFELAISLEVAEHLQPSVSTDFVKCLTRLSDTVLFGAGFCWQPGEGHINNRLHSFWGDLFAQHDYVAFDLIRFKFWNNPSVEPWYCQNTILYCRRNSSVYNILLDAKIPVAEGGVLDVIHPWLFEIMAQEILTLRENLESVNGS